MSLFVLFVPLFVPTVFQGFTFSVCAADGQKQKVITFTGEISGDQKNLKQLLIVADVRPNAVAPKTLDAAIGGQNDTRERPASSVLNGESITAAQ